MFNDMKRFDSSDSNVCKYVFTNEDAVAEAVLYKYESYEKRTVICCSTMSGCPVGCKFCGTGNKFIRNLSAMEIVFQIVAILTDKDINNINSSCERFQIMFMSMGEPMLNWDNVEIAIKVLHSMYPNAELLISTIGVDDRQVFSRMIALSKEIDKVGLQFSIHKSNDWDRNKLIPYEKKMSLFTIRDLASIWWKETGRKVFLNYCVDGTNNKHADFLKLHFTFSPAIFNFTFSVVCSSNETMKDAGFKNLDAIKTFTEYFLNEGHNVRIFDPSGQDDIGGGCGQLWYTQEWMKKGGK
jgi:23S rRNA (adenine2503-C2)-methyltransferase